MYECDGEYVLHDGSNRVAVVGRLDISLKQTDFLSEMLSMNSDRGIYALPRHVGVRRVR